MNATSPAKPFDLIRQISNWLEEHLEPRGVGVVLEAGPRTRDVFLILARAGR